MENKGEIWSDYAQKKITYAQFLSELCCVRQANKDKIKLEGNFWFKPLWKRQFILQLKFANELLKLYPFKLIYSTLKQNPWITTLGARKFLDPAIKKNIILDEMQQTKKEVIRSDIQEVAPIQKIEKDEKVEVQPAFVPKKKQSLADRLKNGKKES